MNTNSFLYALLLTLLLAFGAAAQQAGTLSGIVKDSNGDAVPGAIVTLRGGITHAVITGADGRFVFEGLSKGDHAVTVKANGFSDASRIVKIDSAPVTLDIDLSLGMLEASVTAEVSQEVEKRDIPQAVNLIGSRSVLERANPIIAQAAQEEAGINLQRTSPTMGGIFIRGLVGTKVNVYVDGVRYTTSAQRGGVSTFFNLNEPTGVESIEVIRGSSSAQYGSDALGGTVGILSRTPVVGTTKNEFHGELSTNFNSADRGTGGAAFFSFGTERLGGAVNLAARRAGDLRTANGLDSHSALTRFLGLPSNVLGERLPDTGFRQYGGSTRINYSRTPGEQISFHYSRNQQDNGKRYDQLLGGDGNLIADLRDLMLDFGYLRYVRSSVLGLDEISLTGSFNSQREERVNQGGQGDPLGTITHQYERTTAKGVSLQLSKMLPRRNSLVAGADIYFEDINAPAYTFNPRNNTVVLSRPRIPDEARYVLGGVFVQNLWQAVPDRLRITGALRYNGARYTVKAAASPVVNGLRLWNNDRASVGDVSGRIGAVLRVKGGFRVAANYSRGFRAPSVTDLGTLGLTGDGFEADFASATALGGRIGTTADAAAVSTGLPVARQRSEITDNIDLSARYSSKRFDTEGTFFYIDFKDTITKQTLILPAGAVGRMLGDQMITSQNANGAVFVPLSTNPVLIRANYSAAKIYGFEYELEAKLTRDLKLTGNYTYIHAADKVTGLPPNIEGGTPPPTVFGSIKYEPVGRSFWVEAYATFAGKQDRLSTLDLGDRRTGANRTRGQIQNFFRRGACVRGLTNNPDGVCGTGDETVLLPTGESLLQVQDRVLGAGVNSAPLFRYLPGYGVANLRGGFRIRESSQIFWAFENIFDHHYRNPSWGIDGPGRSLRVGYRYRF